MKKFLLVIGILTLTLSTLTGCQKSKEGTVTIGIGQFAEHGSLDNCREGFIAGLAEECFVEGENLSIDFHNAQADTDLANQIITNFVAKKVDMIATIATPITQSAYGATRDIDLPVVYTAITDPVLAQLANEDGTPTGNITGTSDKLPIEEQLMMIRQILPEAKKIGILYSTSEVNSVSAIEVYKELGPKYGFEIIESGVTVQADIPLATDNILGKVDVISNLTDNTVVSALPIILEKAFSKNIPVFGSEVEQVKIGCLAAMGLDYYELGIQTGKMAAKILKGEAKASEMKFEVIEAASFYGNTAVAEKLGIELPEDLVANAVEMFDEISD
ncbi:MAG: ABC transporter substrate-binding protein [Clostridiales bacterium]|nr:ABC transporter substrate-binding protein [Clostridiales bacterium]